MFISMCMIKNSNDKTHVIYVTCTRVPDIRIQVQKVRVCTETLGCTFWLQLFIITVCIRCLYQLTQSRILAHSEFIMWISALSCHIIAIVSEKPSKYNYWAMQNFPHGTIKLQYSLSKFCGLDSWIYKHTTWYFWVRGLGYKHFTIRKCVQFYLNAWCSLYLNVQWKSYSEELRVLEPRYL